MNTKKMIAGMLVILGALSVGWFATGVARADDDKGENMRMAHSLGSTLEVHINDNGKVLVRGAKVTSVSGSSFNAATVWGAASMSWSVSTTGETEFVHSNGMSDIAVGDFVSFTGKMNTGIASPFSVNADIVKDWSPKIPVNAKTTVEGTVKLISGTTVPTSFVLSVGDKNYTVRIASDTSVLNALWLRTSLTNIRVDDTIRVYGMVNADNTIDATVVRDTSIRI